VEGVTVDTDETLALGANGNGDSVPLATEGLNLLRLSGHFFLSFITKETTVRTLASCKDQKGDEVKRVQDRAKA
jgi:hypothetical protein